MGTAGNRPGYKVYSISTTIRNPIRNTEFLEILKLFDGFTLTRIVKKKIYIELIRHGVYHVTNVENYIKNKYEDNELLTDEEVMDIINNNPQRTGDEGRLMTQIRALKDTGLLTLENNRNSPTMRISKFGNALLNGENIENIYAKAMIGLHSKNPQRTTIYNRARPFLNLLFVINELNNRIKGNKGILLHEFSTFVLSMKDCNYKKAVDEIIKYRNQFKNEKNKVYIENYLYNIVGVNHISYDSLGDYEDDVYRKFNMTGLIYRHGFGTNTYISFTPYYLEKINSIIEKYKDYSFKDFTDTQEYMDYLYNIELPWEKSDDIKRKVIENQQKALEVEINENDSLDVQMEKLNNIYKRKVFENFAKDIKEEQIIEELVSLSRNNLDNTKYKSIPAPVRLEWFIALYMAKKYGATYVKPNLVLDNNGIPKSFAPGGTADIEFVTEEMYCLVEVTLMRDYKQQLNSETTSIADHLDMVKEYKEKCSLLIAPIIHYRVVQFFKYINSISENSIVASSIEHYINSTKENNDKEEFISFIKESKHLMMENNEKYYCDIINTEKV